MRNQGSDDGGKSQGGEESRRIQVGTQSTARTNAPGIFEGGRRHGGDLAGGRQMEMETEDPKGWREKALIRVKPEGQGSSVEPTDQ